MKKSCKTSSEVTILTIAYSPRGASLAVMKFGLFSMGKVTLRELPNLSK